MMLRMEHDITTIDQLISAFGGNKAVAEFFGVVPPAVSMWKHRGIPARLHLRILREAVRRGLPSIADSALGIDEASR